MACVAEVAHPNAILQCSIQEAVDMGEEKVLSNNNTIVDRSSRVLVIGGTGFIGRYVAEASVNMGHPTYALVRSATSKPHVVQALVDSGVNIISGAIEDHNSLLKALRQVDVVISVVGGGEILDQLKIVNAIKEVGTVKRFLPSEFGHDVDEADPAEPALSLYVAKRKVRRAVEEAKIPYTYICCNSIAGWPYYYHTHPTELPPPNEQFEIYGDGSVKEISSIRIWTRCRQNRPCRTCMEFVRCQKEGSTCSGRAYFVTGADIGTYTINAADDPRTLNKSVHFRPPQNFLSLNELAGLWEKKIQKTLRRVVVSEEDLLLIAKANFMPASIVAALTHDIFINGCQNKFSMNEAKHVEACQLYPEINYTTMDDFFDQYL